MKTVKFRLVKKVKGKNTKYFIQKKSILRWRYYKHELYSLAGFISVPSTFKSKEEAIIEIKDREDLKKKNIRFIQYPTIKMF